MAINNKLKISVVIPVFGGEKTITELTHQINTTFNVKDNHFFCCEIIFICDQSPDKSWKIICELAKKYSNVRGLLLGINAGQHNALMAGFSVASGEIIVTMDDDLQHSPHDIRLLIDEIISGKDVVYASFYQRNHTLWKIAGSHLNNYVASFLIQKPKDLYLSPFRAFKSTIRDELLKYKGPYVYVDGLILTSTRNIGTVMVQHHPRFDGESNYGFQKSLSLWMKMATNFSIFPLRLTSIFGMTISIIGFIFAIILIIQKFTYDLMPIGWSSSIVTILIIGGLQLLAIGMVGEYLGRVLLTLNSHPQYVIAERIGLENNGSNNKI